MSDEIAMVSGGFDPLHAGHIRLFRSAREFGNVMVVLNSDEWLKKKKGYVFMPWPDRAAILIALSMVYTVVPVSDHDGTVCDAIRIYRPHFFCNGGDREKGDNAAEARLCEKTGIKMVYGVGGQKIASSSDLVASALSEIMANS